MTQLEAANKYAKQFTVTVPMNEEERTVSREIIEAISMHFVAGAQWQSEQDKEKLSALVAEVKRLRGALECAKEEIKFNWSKSNADKVRKALSAEIPGCLKEFNL